MQDKKKFYMTTAIAYASGKPHIGNTYEIVLSDLIARAKRMEGYDVFFQTGTDEHGEKIELKAQAAGVTPKQFVDEKAAEIKRIWDLMDTTYDKFIRTTDKEHEEQVQKIFKNSTNKGTYTKARTRAGIALPASRSGRRANSLTANVRTAAEKSSLQKKKPISSICRNTPID